MFFSTNIYIIRTDPYQLLQNSPTKSILSTSLHCSPQKNAKQILIPNHPNQPLKHCQMPTSFIKNATANNFLQIQHNIGNLISTGSTVSSHSYFPINNLQHESVPNIHMQKEFDCQNQQSQFLFNQQIPNYGHAVMAQQQPSQEHFHQKQIEQQYQHQEHVYHQQQTNVERPQKKQLAPQTHSFVQPNTKVIYVEKNQANNIERNDNQHQHSLQRLHTVTVHGKI